MCFSRTSFFLQFFLCFFEIRNHDLVGGWATPLKNMKVNWDDENSQYFWENKKWQPNHQPVLVSHVLLQEMGHTKKVDARLKNADLPVK